jgi:hypothetical protein
MRGTTTVATRPRTATTTKASTSVKAAAHLGRGFMSQYIRNGSIAKGCK